MKKKLCIFSCIILLIAALIIFLNIKVTTHRGIDYQLSSSRIPLYLKLIDFFDRHYNYTELVRGILRDTKSEKERIIKIFEWTHSNIRKTPKGFPVIDDHVWNIVVRGYGANDQSSYVFTTLCNYAGIEAFYTWVYSTDKTKRVPLSFVRLSSRWIVFDPYNGIYFKDKSGEIADIDKLKNGNWAIEYLLGAEKLGYDPKEYFVNLPEAKNIGLTRSGIQSPLKRLIFEVKKWIKQK